MLLLFSVATIHCSLDVHTYYDGTAPSCLARGGLPGSMILTHCAVGNAQYRLGRSIIHKYEPVLYGLEGKKKKKKRRMERLEL